ncbi:MAG: heme lyase CcmF/NrfE family subunit [Alphaproteobacteria bacterium]
MIAELGHVFLVLAFMASVSSLILLATGMQSAAKAGQRAVFVFCIFVLAAFISLMLCHVGDDFSVKNVFEHSHSSKPLFYKITGVWGNHEGSLLLWLLLLAAFTLWQTLGQHKKTEPALYCKSLWVMMAINTCFAGFSLFFSNPFGRLNPMPTEGMDLNPLLQDPALAIHPPLLYSGYTGFSIAFAFAIAGLWQRNKAWAVWARKPALLAWGLLTLGIMLGSWWAYYELGWGGWWFWDPVENASLIPWLVGAALIHSLVVIQKRHILQHWGALLAILTFSLCLMGVFLVRSGVLTSVHAFAVDPARGLVALAILTLFGGGGLFIYGVRARDLRSPSEIVMFSREGMLLFNNMLLLASAGVVLIGTLYPLFIQAIANKAISVGPPYFNRSFVPIIFILTAFLGLGPMLAWGGAGLWRKRYGGPLLVTLAAASVPFIFGLSQPFYAAMGLAMASWCIAPMLWMGWQQRRQLSPIMPMLLGHIGLGITIVGVTAASCWQTEKTAIVTVGQSMEIGQYRLAFNDLRPKQAANFQAIAAHIDVYEGNDYQGSTEPSLRWYQFAQQRTTEAGLLWRWNGMIFITISPADVKKTPEQLMPLNKEWPKEWQIHVRFHPFIYYIWWGAIIMAMGGLWPIITRNIRAKKQ